MVLPCLDPSSCLSIGGHPLTDMDIRDIPMHLSFAWCLSLITLMLSSVQMANLMKHYSIRLLFVLTLTQNYNKNRSFNQIQLQHTGTTIS